MPDITLLAHRVYLAEVERRASRHTGSHLLRVATMLAAMLLIGAAGVALT